MDLSWEVREEVHGVQQACHVEEGHVLEEEVRVDDETVEDPCCVLLEEEGPYPLPDSVEGAVQSHRKDCLQKVCH